VYDAILFDLDGTLIDTERLSVQSGRLAFEAFGHDDAEALLHRLVGVDMPTALGLIGARYPTLDVAALDRHWADAFAVAASAGIPLKPGAADLLRDLAPHFSLGLVTSSGRDQAMMKLKLTGLLPMFHTIITRDDVTAPKPAPAPYLLAAHRFGADPARCLAFEDSEPGSEAAFLAGMRVVQVPDVIPSTGRFAHHIADDLAAGARLAGLFG
jgi:HAD superfamily hydrolase (TIGR01509 family)